jgi:L-threonylcarbamoyladenylate synthase
VFPADTVYGLACDPQSPAAVARLYELKGRAPQKPAAVMFFALDRALAALPELGPNTRALLGALLPGPLTVLIENPLGRFALAGGRSVQADDAPRERRPALLGLRVPAATGLEAVAVPVLQSSANLAGGPDARRLDQVPDAIRAGADLVLDGGTLPGTPSTVLDLCGYEDRGQWDVRREGAVSAARVADVIERMPRRGG